LNERIQFSANLAALRPILCSYMLKIISLLDTCWESIQRESSENPSEAKWDESCLSTFCCLSFS